MGTLVMSDWTNKILIEAPPSALGIKTFSCTAGTVKPGFPVTATGETDPDVVVAGAADDVATGIALCKPNHDIDTAYAAGEFIPVALCGSGAIVWAFLKTSGGELVVGTPLHLDGTPTNYLVIGEGGLYEYVGKAVKYSADQANDRPIQVRLR